MIFECLCNVLFAVLNTVVGLLPFSDVEIDSDAISDFFGVIECILYFLPMGTIALIFSIITFIVSFKIVVSIIKTIWQLLPLL